MKIAKLAALNTFILCAIFLCAASTANAQTADACKLLDAHPGWRSALNDAENRWGVSGGSILAFIDQESRFRATASNGPNYGYAQSTSQTWNWFRRSANMPSASRTDFSDCVQFVGWHFKTMNSRLGIGVNDVGHQYLAYQMGEGGYRNRRPSGTSVSRSVASKAAIFNRQLAGCD